MRKNLVTASVKVAFAIVLTAAPVAAVFAATATGTTPASHSVSVQSEGGAPSPTATTDDTKWG